MLIQEKFPDLKAALQEIWGYSDFRYPQEEIINCLLQGKDALIVMPTGGGKSICFQLPALLQDGLTIVLSPLIALMENQVQQLQNKQLPAALIHSQQPKRERNNTLKAIANQNLRLLYLSPETLLSAPVWETLIQPQVKINGIILDEAHCLVQWGTTFRPAYTRLGAVRSTLGKIHSRKIAIAAFTATADPHTQQVITKTLKLYQPAKFLLSPYRANLHLQVKTIWTRSARRQQTLKFIQDKPRQSGLIYVRSRKDSEELANWLRFQKKLSTFPYHAGLTDSQRRKIENQWLRGEIPFVICTSAFGMGIDKSNCRWIVHYHTPELLSEYLQEIGRGGRDGQVANALALVSEPTGWFNPEDKQRSQFFTRQIEQKALQAKQIIQQIPAQGKIDRVIAEYPQGAIGKAGAVAIALSILQSLDRLYWQDPFHYRTKSSATSFRDWQSKQHYWQKQMQQFLRTKQCRWQFLLAAFGLREESSGFQCGNCDRCQRDLK